MALKDIIFGKKNQSESKPDKTVSSDKKKAVKKGQPDVNELEAPYRPTIQFISAEGIGTYWKKPEISSGYEIYRSYKEDETGELVMTINDKLLGIWTDDSFDRSYREIFYRVRSFLKQDDGTVKYSAFTEPFSAKYRDDVELEREITYVHSGDKRRMRAFYGWGELEDAVWKSSDESIATLGEDGTITGVSKGEVEFTCESPSLGLCKSAKVVVDRDAPEPLTEITSRYVYNDDSGIWSNPDSENTDCAVIMMTGDMMCGKGQIEKQYNEEEGWNFNDSFDYVKEVTGESDFTIGNLETLLDPAWPYMTDEWFIDNISNCNAPPRYLDAIKYGGFDAVVMANNHTCDGGLSALLATIDQVDRYKLIRTGLYKNQDEKRYSIVDINGIKVGFLAYMSPNTGYKGKDRQLTPEQKKTLLNNYTDEKAARDVADCRKDGAEYIIVYMHWGQKNYKNPTKSQITEAQGVADAGADYIIGSNPHVLERYDEINTKDGRIVPCFYSLGNFHARMNQIIGNRDSVMVKIKLERDADGKIRLSDNTYIPFFTFSRFEGCYLAPVSVSLAYHGDKKRYRRKDKYDRIRKLIGNKIRICDE